MNEGDEAELMEDIRKSDERRARFKTYLDKALVDPDNKFDFAGHPFPWTACMVIWDGPVCSLWTLAANLC